MYSKGPWRKLRRWCDTSVVNKQEKDWHDWQQPLEDVEHWVRQFSKPGDLVVDPCGGGFTTAVACYRLGRRFIGCDCDQECVLPGLQRLAEERAKRKEILEDLRIWIEDAQDLGDDQHVVESVWTECTGLDNNYLKINIPLLPESHRQIWQTLGTRRLG